MRTSFLRRSILACAFLFVGAIVALAQEGTIVGTITDPSGAAVPNVSVTITNTDTGNLSHYMTNDVGQFVAPDLHIGHYTVRAESSNFKTAEQKDIALAVGDRRRVDFQLQLGSTQESITVEANTVQVQADSGEVSDVITGKQIAQLAANGRSMYQLINLTPGASSGQADFSAPVPVGGDANVSFNGLRQGHNIYLLDGGESDDRGGAGGSSVMPSLESLAEFRMLTSNYSADYGLSSAATMTAVIKSGTRQFHASAWEYLRNDALDARNYFNAAPAPVAELRFNTYGFNVGGPLSLHPKSSNPKTFFFYNMEWRSLIQGQTLNQTVPLASEYGGVIPTQICSVPSDPSTCKSTVITVPDATQVSAATLAKYTADGLTPGQPFPNNTIPADLLDPNSQALLAAGIFPKPTNGGSQFIGGNNVPTNLREEIVRVDHRFTDKFSVYGHFLAEQITQGFGTAQWSGDNLPTVGDTFGNPSYSAVIHATHSIRPNLLNEIAFNYNGNRINIVPNGVVAQPSGFSVPRIFSGPNNLNRIPEIHLGGATGADYTSSSWPWHNKADDYQIRDDISWVKGAHQIKMGASWAIYKKVQDLFGQTQGGFTFNNTFTGYDFADYLLGLSNSYTELAVQDHGLWNNVSYAAYIQDNWRATHRLTLNLGLRWDGIPHTYEANNRMGNFYPNLYDPALAATFDTGGNLCSAASNPPCAGGQSPGLGASPNPILNGYLFYLNGIGIPGKNGVPKGLVDNHWATFGPRVGFAYDLLGTGKTIVRGGFGTMYERLQGNDMYNAGANVPFSSSVTFNNVFLSSPTTSVATGSTLTAPITVGSVTGLDRNSYQPPVSYQYSAGVQQGFGAKSVLSVAYVGNQNRHQNDYIETNLPDPSLLPCIAVASNCSGSQPTYNTIVPFLGFHSVKMARNEANSHYNSLQFDFHSQASRDLFLQAAYTLSRAIDPSTPGGSGYDLSAVTNPYLGWRHDIGPSILDRTNIAFVNFVYDLPILRNSTNGFLKNVVGGWTFSGIVSMVSGTPLTLTESGISSNVCNTIPNCVVRPDFSGSKSYPQTVNSWFNTAGFAAAPAGTFGTLPYNAFRGPGRDNWNLSLAKSFVINAERGSRVEFRADSFNAWNHTEFKDVSSAASFDASGNINNNFGAVTTAHDPREFQLALKVYF
ncbi:MAG TPA: carboxypeptidase regulatory-like domain-containing protein [Terriglobales bacterium]|jgi:hypothetical protein